MKLYRPVTITSAEQAEALPDGTLAHGHWPDRQYGDGLVKKIGGAWMPKSVTGIGLAPSDALIDWTALVPIEARRVESTDIVDPAVEAPPSARAYRFQTLWEEM